MARTGLRERKKLETRQALRTAALRLTAERGLEHVTVEDIAEAADVSTRTLFNYFSSKEEAIVGSDPDWLAHVVKVLAERPADEAPLQSLHAVLDEIARLVEDSRELQVLRRKVLADNPSLLPRHIAAFVDFERVLLGALRERVDDTTSYADTALVVAAAVAAMRVSVDLWIDAAGGQALPEILQHAVDRLTQGFGATTVLPKGSASAPRRTQTRKVLP